MIFGISLSAIGCSSDDEAEIPAGTLGSVYYLNFKPEQDGDWKQLASMYTELTGVRVDVVTAASGEYETTLLSEIGKSEAPTLFQVNGPIGLEGWRDYTYNLAGTPVYQQLKSDDFALIEDGKVCGIAYVLETYGLIYNKELLEKAGYTADDITNFETLKAVTDDIQARKDELGIKGAFASAGLDGSSDWRFKTHLANIPIYYEYENDGIATTEAIKGTYLDNYKAIWDLYITNSTTDPAQLSAKTGNDAVAEFVNGDAIFYQNGTWAYNDIKSIGDENLGILPIYIGVDGEENQGLVTGSENYWCVNQFAAPEDIQATLDFLYWCVTSDEGKDIIAHQMNFVTPFIGFTEEYLPANPLIVAADEYITQGKTSVDWCFSTIPSEEWKNGVGSALKAYSAGLGTWEAVEDAFIDGWESEYKLMNSF
ncbi:MAG: ABC transporter substrate-binding protein [Epulopiscium sp. Nuni2H_MBin001]|nr:MAG: ABC transporter substrate-binding protein [Epulopiscium sp. Nuni2H_MBin001]